MGSDPAPFFANLFLYYYECKWLNNTKKIDNKKARKFGNTFRFIDDLLSINDGNEFEKNIHDIYPEELELKRENLTDSEASFLDLYLKINDGQIEIKLYDKRDSYSFPIVRLPYKSSNLPHKMFYSSVGAEILRIARVTSSIDQLTGTVTNIITRMLHQGAVYGSLKTLLKKIVNSHDTFVNFGLSNAELVDRIIPNV